MQCRQKTVNWLKLGQTVFYYTRKCTYIFSEGYRRYLALCLTESVSQLVSQSVSQFFLPPCPLPIRNYLKFFWWLLTVTATPQLMLNRKWYQGSKPEMEFHMMNIIYAALSISAQAKKTTFSCKDDCTLTKHTGRWTYSAKNFEIPLCHIPPLRSFFVLRALLLPSSLLVQSFRPQNHKKRTLVHPKGHVGFLSCFWGYKPKASSWPDTHGTDLRTMSLDKCTSAKTAIDWFSHVVVFELVLTLFDLWLFLNLARKFWTMSKS